MRPTRYADISLALLGAVLIAAGVLISIPVTLNKLSLLEARIVKYGALLLGAAFVLVALFSLLSKRSIFDRRKVKTISLNILLLIAVSAVCLLVLEGILHLMPQQEYAPYVQRDEVLHHSLIPNAHTRFVREEWDTAMDINSIGLRDDEVPPKGSSTRILMLGDSFTMGFGVEQNETFSELVERRLRSDGYDVEVINAGVQGYSPLLEYLYLRERGIALKPDIVVVNVDMSDVHDDYVYGRDAVYEDGVVIAVPGNNATAAPGLLVRVFQNIRVVHFLKTILDQAYARMPKSELDAPWASDIEHNRFAITRLEPAQDEDAHWKRTEANLLRIKEYADAHNMTLVITAYPYGHQVSPDGWRLGKHVYGFGSNTLYSDRPMRRLAAFSENHSITFINTLPAFQSSGEAQLFFPYDGHFTAEGHAVMAAAISEQLGVELGKE